MKIALAFSCLISNLAAQNFVAEGIVPTVAQDGFYRIALTPHATIFINPGFNNLRIIDEAGKETPYIIEEEVPVFSSTVSEIYSKVPSLKFHIKEIAKDKQTHLAIQLDTACWIDNLEFFISGQPFYHRYATLYETGTRLNKKKKTEPFQNYLQHVEITSTHSATLQLAGMKLENLLLAIENDDNPPLQIDSVQAFQLNRYATAYLKKGIGYKLKMGDAKMQPPVYDLGFFRGSIPNQPTVIKPLSISAIAQSQEIKAISVFSNSLIIWVAIILVAVVLGYMSVKMIGEKGVRGRG